MSRFASCYLCVKTYVVTTVVAITHVVINVYDFLYSLNLLFVIESLSTCSEGRNAKGRRRELKGNYGHLAGTKVAMTRPQHYSDHG